MNDILTNTEIQFYQGRLAAVHGLEHPAIFINTKDLERMLKEINANRLTIEKLAERLASGREVRCCVRCGEVLKGVMALTATLCGLCADDKRNGR